MAGGTAGGVDGDTGGMDAADGAGVVDGAGVAAGTGVVEGTGIAGIVDGAGASADRDGVADSVVTVGDGAGGRCRC